MKIFSSLWHAILFLTSGKARSMKDIRKEVAEGKITLLDVRTDDEWRIEHATGAMHIDVSQLDAGVLPSIPKDQPIYTYCLAGGRAGRACDVLRTKGFTHVENLGGLKEWKNMGGETTSEK